MVRDLIFFWLYLEMSKPNQLNLLSTFNLLIHLFSGILHIQKAITRKMADIANNMMRASIFNQIGHNDNLFKIPISYIIFIPFFFNILFTTAKFASGLSLFTGAEI